MAGELGLPVPPGFTLTTEACRAYREGGWSEEFEVALRNGVARIETETGLGFGHADRPLLVSVRSGAPISMPGMLDSILDLGWNTETHTGLAKRGATFADDCRDRFERSFNETVGGDPPDDPWEQLFRAVEAVFRSVDSHRAAAYREREGLEHEMLTAVNVQAMVFGNHDERSATGVVFSRNPSTGEPNVYGDLLFCAQGEDVVSGSQGTESIDELERRLPEVALQLKEWLKLLERDLGDLCEVEFTIDRGQLWLLQVRAGKCSPRAALRIARDFAEDPNFPLDRREATLRVRGWLWNPPQISDFPTQNDCADAVLLGEGIGASPGIAVGEVVVDPAEAFRQASDGRSVILVRPETSPSDVEGMSKAVGLLTARGGLVSHAAVVARGWGITAVVGLEALEIDECGFTLDGRRVEVGETVSLDGHTGRVYAGVIVGQEREVPEAAIFRAWSKELGLEMAADVTSSTASREPASNGQADAEAFLRSLSIRGSATDNDLAEAYSLEASDASALAEQLEAKGLIEPSPMLGWTLTDVGRDRASALLEADQLAAGVALVEDALHGFQPLDARFKQAVTDWQIRTIDGEVTSNDHQDSDWDSGVLARLSQVGAALNSSLTMLSYELPRLTHYQSRYRRALDAAVNGDGRYVASPRVDSMHGIWFELHEDLIRLAGSSRSEELAAGRSG